MREGDYEESLTFEAMQKRVTEFVQRMGDKMDFNICMDGPHKKVLSTWMTASGMSGIPAASVVDQQGRVAWIGHPSGTVVDKVIDELLAGTFDYKTAAENFVDDATGKKRKAEEDSKTEADIKPVLAALSAGDYKTALAKIDDYCAAHPNRRDSMKSYRTKALAHVDPDQALEMARNSTGMQRTLLASGFADEENLPRPLYAFAAEVLEEVAAEPNAKRTILAPLAKSYFRMGNVPKAIEVQKTLIEWARTKRIAEKGEASQKYMAAQEATLKVYLAAQ